MPNIKGAKRRVRANGRKEVVNTYVSSSMKTAIKNFEKKLEKFCTKEFQEECYQKLQKNKNGEFFEGAYTKKEFLKVYFYNMLGVC